MDKFEAVADVKRRTILELLSPVGEELTSGVISTYLPIMEQTTSHHLYVLREVGLLRLEKRRNNHFFSLDRDGLAEVEKWFADRRLGLPYMEGK